MSSVTGTAPPLTWWGHTWRLLLVLAVTALTWVPLGLWQLRHAPLWFALDLATGVACTVVAMVWRRRFPVTVALVTNVVSIGSFSSGGAACLALVSLATRRRWRELVPVTLVCLLTIPFVVVVNPLPGEDPRVDAAVVVVVIGLLVAVGLYVGSRRELLATLRSRAESAEAEQAAKVAQARSAERTRIAREMHDVLAHRISLVTMHAGALAYRQDLGREQVHETALTIQETAHQAMTELRGVLGVLREGPGDAVPELPQPAARDVVELVEESRAAGMRVELQLRGDLDDVSGTAGRTVYRVVQEGLTNARKHAAGTPVEVAVDVGAQTVEVRVTNPLPLGTPTAPLPGSGLGLVGLRERVELARGSLSHRVSADRRYVLEARIPWAA
ncbi:signal transduction histidine kinase [Aeromicrobium sp. SORGH_AS981]|nr:signal transduction histidine kinase [Aeromicrobium sp. SORGH_AS_0981]